MQLYFNSVFGQVEEGEEREESKSQMQREKGKAKRERRWGERLTSLAQR